MSFEGKISVNHENENEEGIENCREEDEERKMGENIGQPIKR
jgi:hypothetical protein